MFRERMPEFVKKVLRPPYSYVKRFVEGPMPSDLANFEHNRELWNRYAKRWEKKTVTLDVPDIRPEDREHQLQFLGDEWGRPPDVGRIITDYIYPYITSASIVAEIGSGGGRIASKVVSGTKELYCFDIASEMLKRAKVALSGHPNARFVLLQEPKFPGEFGGMFDFVYSFDVFVHFDLCMMWKYLNEIWTILKPGGKVFIHTTNLQTEDGWQWFSSQDGYSVGGGYFVSPEIVEILIRRSNFKVVKRSTLDPTNFYLARDYLVVLER